MIKVEPGAAQSRDPRCGHDVEALKQSFLNHIAFTRAKVPGYSTPQDRFVALAMTVRDRLIERWIATRKAYYGQQGTKRVYYLSLEFLIGRTLGNSLVNLEMYEECYQALFELGYDLEEIRELEEEAGLGNGGLGRLAACFLDSMATLELPGYGYGIRYDYGMFHQRIRDGQQVEEPDDWLRCGSPWEIARPEDTFRVQLYGRVEPYEDAQGNEKFRWVDTRDVLALPYDVPVPGYRNNTVNTLRLFSTKSTNEFDLTYFNHGDYLRACEDKALTENITKVLYPKDDFDEGRALRLKQEYLLVSASLQDILARFTSQHDDWSQLPELAAIQLNDTHPALAIPELMRLLMDHEGLGWDEAWDITVRTFAYTNHTVLPEALEKWSVWLLGNLLPRHMEIIYAINWRFLEEVARHYPGDNARMERMSVIEEGDEPRVRMAHLAIVGSHSVNGVSALHTQILKDRVLREFYEFYPDRFNNKTNGVTPRRWLKKANSPLAFLISEAIGDGWVTDLDRLRELAPLADDAEFQARWREVKQLNKERLAGYLKQTQGLVLNPEHLFDCQVKRIHEYKRQLLNILHVITLYNRIKQGRAGDAAPRMVLLAGKAAPAYYLAKLIIRLATAVGDVLRNDPEVAGRLQLVFPENYGVSLAESIIPAAELSEQISMAGMEASGTGNMKFALNGALTIGTLDGANVEIKEEVGDENIFIFGMTAEEVEAQWAAGYDPWHFYHGDPELQTAIEQIAHNRFSQDEPGLFQPLLDRLLHQGDQYMVLADYAAYIRCQEEVNRAYRDRSQWTRMSILNTAYSGKFSSDRTIREYAEEIWNVKPVPVKL
ncbi:MAG: glycogen/starch/alpha-glucan phosphorylase [bacterium]|nr:glycogen/starch/alpha-glucan phosphorylase [bacterium]